MLEACDDLGARPSTPGDGGCSGLLSWGLQHCTSWSSLRPREIFLGWICVETKGFVGLSRILFLLMCFINHTSGNNALWGFSELFVFSEALLPLVPCCFFMDLVSGKACDFMSAP